MPIFFLIAKIKTMQRITQDQTSYTYLILTILVIMSLNLPKETIIQKSINIFFTQGSVINKTQVETVQNGQDIASIVKKVASMTAGNNLTVTAANKFENSGANVEAGGNATIDAKKGITFDTVTLENKTESGTPEGENYTLSETITHVGSNLNVGKKLTLTTDGMLEVVGSDVSVGGDADLNAKDGINITSVKDTTHEITKKTEHSSGFLTTTTTTTQTEDYVETLKESSLKVGGKSQISTEKDVNLTAANIELGQGADITADNVNITGLNVNEIHNKEEHSTTGLDIGILKMELSGKDETEKSKNFDPTKMRPTDTAYTGTSIKTGGELNIKTKKDILIEGSTIEGTTEESNINLAAGKTLAITSAQSESSYDHSKEERSFDLGKTLSNAVEIKDNGVEATLATYSGTGEHTAQNTQNQAESTIKTKGNFTTKSGADTVVMGSNIEAKAVDMQAEGNMTVMNAEEMQNLLKEASELTISLKARVGNQYVDTVTQLADAVNQASSAIQDATGDNSKATDLAKTAKALQAAIATARAAKAVDTAAKTAATTPLFGTYMELKTERDETKTSTQTDATTAKKSSITATGGDVNLTAKEKLAIIGSDLNSQQGDITLAGKKGVDIVSSEELNSLTQSTAHNNETLSLGTRGIDGSYSNNTSATKGTGKTQSDSTISAQNGTFKVQTEGDLNFSGAQGLAKKVDLTEVKGDTIIASKQNTQTQETNSQSMSVGSKMSYGIGQDKETSQQVGNQTMLIGTEEVKTGGKKLKIDGAMLANAKIVETDVGDGIIRPALVDQGNMTISNETIEITDQKTKTEKTSEGYGGGSTVQANFGKDTQLTETTTYGTIGNYTKITTNPDGTKTSEAVAANHDLNETQEITKTEESKGKGSVDLDTKAITNTVEYANESVNNLTKKEDFETLKKQTDMNYQIGGEDMIYYQNGVQNNLKDAEKNTQLISQYSGVPDEQIGIINNQTDGKNIVGLGKDLLEYGNNSFELKDILNAKTYEDIAKNGEEKNTIILFSAENKDAQKAMEVLALEGRSLDNKVEFVSVGSPVSKAKLEESAAKVNASVKGQYNTIKDPVANAMSWVAGTGGLAAGGLVVGIGVGGAVASGAGPMAAYGGALVGGGAILYSINKYHSFENYLKNDVKGLQGVIKNLRDENNPPELNQNWQNDTKSIINNQVKDQSTPVGNVK